MSLTHKPSSRRWAAPAASLTAFGFFAAALAAPAGAAGLVQINGHIPDLAKQSTTLGVLPADQALLVSISLPLRNKAALDDLLKGLNDPYDARYNHYLTPTQFAAQFGPTQAQYNALIAYAQSKGLTVTQTYPARTYISLSGTAGQVDDAFGVTLKQFKSPEGRVFHAPDTEVKVPSTVSGLIAAVVGLDDANPPRPLAHTIHRLTDAQVKEMMPDATPLVQNPGEQGTGPGGGFAPADLRTAYGLNSTSLNGAGQTIAMVEYGTKYNVKDALKYENQFGLPRVPLAVVNVAADPAPTVYTGASVETDLDVDMQIAMAPGAKQILVYLQGSTGSSLDAINQVYSDGKAKQLSISYGFGTETSATTPSANQTALQAAYLQLATAGVSVYVSTGDGGSAPSGRSIGIDISSDEPAVCAVGGTALTVQNPGVNEAYKTESTWNYDGTAADGAGGGGVSKQWTIAGNSTYAGATYQANAAKFAAAVTGSNVSATMRNVPDISCDASPETGVAIYASTDPGYAPGWIVEGGTSESAPLWAGFTALINQNRVSYNLGTLGLPNNSLYPLAYNANGLSTGTNAGSATPYELLFHDVNDGSSNSTATRAPITVYKAVTGFDASTGLGTMQGVNLIAALSGPTPTATPVGHGGG